MSKEKEYKKGDFQKIGTFINKKYYNQGWNEALQEMKKKIKSIRLSDFEDSLPQSLLLKDIEALKKEKQEGK